MLLLGLINLLFFAGTFRLLQNDQAYQSTLGKISLNYERNAQNGIAMVPKPFTDVDDHKFNTWDAAIYSCLRDHMYQPTMECHGNVRAAFFPLFPFLWKLSGTSSIGISLINYGMFVVSITVLILLFYRATLFDQLIVSMIIFTLPSTIIYYIPYSESLFLITGVMTAYGFIKERYWIYLVGGLLMAMVRPATIFVVIAIPMVEYFHFRYHPTSTRQSLAHLFYSVFPFLLGYFVVFFVQFIYTKSWSAFYRAHEKWNIGLRSFGEIGDWSVESFGLSTFTIFFISLPALLYLVYLVSYHKKAVARQQVDGSLEFRKEMLLLASVTYLVGVFVFTLLTSGGNLHSFYRFSLCSPFFYIAMLILLVRLDISTVVPALSVFIACGLLLSIFLYCVPAGGDKMQFRFAGLYLCALSTLFLLVRKSLTFGVQVFFAILLLVGSYFWSTYLLNSFLNQGWIFT